MSPSTALPNNFQTAAKLPELVLNFAKDAYFLLDENLNVQYYNASATTELFGNCGKALYLGMSMAELVADAERQNYIRLCRMALFGRDGIIETYTIAPDGTPFYYEHSITPCDDGHAVFGVLIQMRNTTGDKRIHKQIQEAEERWRFALEAANQAAWDWNMVSNKVIYSGCYENIYGFKSGNSENDIAEWEQRIHPEDKLRMRDALNEHIASHNPYYESTYRLQTTNSDYKWIMARGKLISKDADGNPLRMIGTHTDLTEVIRIKEELKTIAERFMYAAKASSQALWEWNAVTGEAYVSPSFTELFGWEADSNQKFEQWHSYIHPDDQEQIVASYYNTLKDPEALIWTSVYRFQKKEGNYATVSDRAYIIRNSVGEAIKVIGATQDITAIRKTEADLFNSNQRFDNMMQATHELLWDWDIKADYIYRAEKGLQKVYGLQNDEAVKKMDQWIARVHPDDRHKLHKIIWGLPTATHKQTFEVEYRFLKDNGRYIHICDRGIILKDEAGLPSHIIGAAQDVSEKKRLEDELIRSELEHTKLINQATVDSQEQERAEIGKELHDNINQVLTTTRLYLELALSNEDMMRELVKKSSKTISNVINEIRQLSRSLMDPAIGDLGIVESISDLAESINITKKINVNLQIAGQLEDLLDNKQSLTVYRIIQEALNNVIKHAYATTARVSISVNDTLVEVAITDDGIGFEKQHYKKGAGLKNITNRVYLINGILKIDSVAGIGTSILIRFPLQRTL